MTKKNCSRMEIDGKQRLQRISDLRASTADSPILFTLLRGHKIKAENVCMIEKSEFVLFWHTLLLLLISGSTAYVVFVTSVG